MIVAIGTLLARIAEKGDVKPAGFLATLAISAVESGANVQVVARVDDGAIGDAVLLGLAAAGVGHVATLRDPGQRTPVIRGGDLEDPGDDQDAVDPDPSDGPTLEAPDVALALRYLGDYRAVVLAHAVDEDILREVASAATWAGAHLLVVAQTDVTADVTLPDGSFVLTGAPDSEGLAARIGRYVAAVDTGIDPDTAYAVLTEATT